MENFQKMHDTLINCFIRPRLVLITWSEKSHAAVMSNSNKYATLYVVKFLVFIPLTPLDKSSHLQRLEILEEAPPAVFVQAGIGFFSFVNSWKPKNSFVNSWKRCCSWIVKRQNIVREFVKFEIFVREFVNSDTFVSCILTKSLHKIKKLSYPHFLDLINRLTSPDGNRIQIEATPIMKQLPHNMRGLWNYHWVHCC